MILIDIYMHQNHLLFSNFFIAKKFKIFDQNLIDCIYDLVKELDDDF